MTNQEQFKKETTDLHNLLKNYARRYDFMNVGGGRGVRGVLSAAVDQLRAGLEIVRTDEENTKQDRADSMC